MTQIDNWEEKLKKLKCIDYAMYTGSYDVPCRCGSWECKDQATFYNNLKELKNFIQEQITLAKQEEHNRWANQSANQHDEMIRAEEKKRIVEIIKQSQGLAINDREENVLGELINKIK